MPQQVKQAEVEVEQRSDFPHLSLSLNLPPGLVQPNKPDKPNKRDRPGRHVLARGNTPAGPAIRQAL